MNFQDELNDKQYEAVSAEDRFLRIIAGAGSGKTRVLTYRIAFLIGEKAVSPGKILAITFTNKVAREMNERTKALLPGYNISHLSISTFHAWCAKFLRREIGVLGFPKNYVIYDEEDQLRLIKSIGESFGYKKTDDMNKIAMNWIGAKKTLGQLLSDVEINKVNSELEKKLLKYFEEYEHQKAEAKALDFDDLLIYTIKILKSFEDIRERYLYRYDHILIDEFQDTNDLQFQLLTYLIGPNTSLYVVGDPDQTIYTWRGANQKIILDFDKVFKGTRSIILNENYRSTNEILGAANSLIAYNVERIHKDLFTKKRGGNKIVVKNLDTAIAEANFIGNKIEEIKASHPEVQYKDFAIIYRSSYLSVRVENALTTRRIPYAVYGGLKFYSRREIKDCLAYFRLLMNEDDNVSFERIINVPKRSMGEKSVILLKQEASAAGLSYFRYVLELDKHQSQLKPAILKSLNKLKDLTLETQNKLKENLEAYSEVLDRYLKDLGYYDYLESEEDEDDDRIDNVRALIDDIRNFLKSNVDSTFEEYLQNVTLLSSQDDMDGSDKVSLMTAHTAKGLEFEYVFVMGLNQGVFPNQKALDERRKSGMEEERRLAYVAFTRAKKELYLTLNRDYSYVSSSNNQPSQFIKEAGLDSVPLFQSTLRASGNGNDRIYKYNFDQSSRSGLYKKESNETNTIDLNNIGNGITWHVGDIAVHRVFGEGEVLEVEGDIITVMFRDFGKKKLLGQHPALSKKGN
ncbi:MAG: UvrD-helicase domain-containing protein [Bacilli bacterium]|nr:UvrD-helicase domain-containing protein [Bacilli bacterium]